MPFMFEDFITAALWVTLVRYAFRGWGVLQSKSPT